jgi:hypothetical protein
VTGRLINFLKALETAVPPPPHCHHAITYARYGSDEKGWQDRLALQVGVICNCKELIFHCFFLNDEDLLGPADAVIAQIVIALNRPGSAAQVSHIPTRYYPNE